jgi:hypothetical protein
MDEEKRGISRREFATGAALAGAAATLGAAPVLARRRGQLTTGMEEAAPREAELRVQTILALYPGRFTEEQQNELRKASVGTQKSLERLRAYHITNADDPALYLKPLIEREKKPAAPSDGNDGKTPAHASAKAAAAAELTAENDPKDHHA